ncbi:RabGAP/TBC [Neoconidiobolus thromboides FSU 785]|nr:RabGAP/TBC [Neoconidiobolus thromboides FSU 785]
MPVENEVKEVNKEEKEKESKKKVEKKEEKQKDIGAKAEKEEEIISEEEKEVETEKESETEKEDEEIEHETEREEEEEDINEKLIIEEKIKVAKLKEHNDDVKEVSEKDDNEKKEKVKKIEKAILEKDREKLKELAKSKYGLISSSLRSDAWYILLHGDKNHSKRSKVKTHPDDEQMKRDGQRAFKNIPRNIDDVKRKRKRVELIELLKAIFQREPELNYYQGFHEIASVLLLVLGKRKVANCIQNLSLNYLRDSMQGTLGPMMRQMALSSYLIKVEEPELYEFLLQTKAQSYYGLSWVLTWFTLGSESLTRCSRYIDLFLASNPILPIYIMAAATIKRKGKILKLEKNRELVYNYLKTFPSELEDEELIEKALSFYKRFPPEKLQKESKVALGEK